MPVPGRQACLYPAPPLLLQPAQLSLVSQFHPPTPLVPVAIPGWGGITLASIGYMLFTISHQRTNPIAAPSFHSAVR